MEHDFEDIEVKENAVELLEYALKHKRKKCMIGTGSMTDPYIPLEMETRNVRKALDLIYKYGFGFTVITKSDLVLRDLDLLQKINKKTKCVVHRFWRVIGGSYESPNSQYQELFIFLARIPSSLFAFSSVLFEIPCSSAISKISLL